MAAEIMATLVILAAAEPVEVALDKRADTRVAVDQVLVVVRAEAQAR